MFVKSDVYNTTISGVIAIDVNKIWLPDKNTWDIIKIINVHTVYRCTWV